MAITESQKSSLTKSLKKLRSSLGSLKGADKKRFESSSTSDKLSRALGGASTSLRKQQQQEQQSIAMGTQELNQTPTEVITVPKLSEIPNYQSTLDANNMALGLTPTETTTPGTTNTTAELLAAAGVDMIPKKESLADDYMRAQRDLGKDEFQRQVNDYSAQINAITAKATADQLRVTGQGRGIPEPIIGGQQAQIAKEAAIKVLPLQAQLAAAQGNLEMAQENLNTWYKIRVQDVENDYQYRTNLYNAIQGQISKEDERRYNEKISENEFNRDKEMLAIKNDYDRQFFNLQQSVQGTETIKYNQNQHQAAIFGQRVTDAMGVLDEGKGYFVPIDSEGTIKMPDFLKSEDRRKWEQAENNFITAVLRRESGASIAPDEYVSARKVYIPIATDSQDVLDQKKRAREVIREGMINEAGGAYTNLNIRLDSAGSTGSTSESTKSGTTSSGITYTEVTK